MSHTVTHINTLLLLLSLCQMTRAEKLSELGSLQWKNRIIILNDMKQQVEARNQLEDKQDEITERDILWFILSQDKVLSNYEGELSSSFGVEVREKYQMQANQVILIGKDGGLKSRFDEINLNVIFTDIDAMPMRQQEMNKNSKR